MKTGFDHLLDLGIGIRHFVHFQFLNLKKNCSPDTFRLRMSGQVGTRPRNLRRDSKQMDQPFRRYKGFSTQVPRKMYLSKEIVLVVDFYRICTTNCVSLDLQFFSSQLAVFFSDNFYRLQKNSKECQKKQKLYRGSKFTLYMNGFQTNFYVDFGNYTHFLSFLTAPRRLFDPLPPKSDIFVLTKRQSH